MLQMALIAYGKVDPRRNVFQRLAEELFLSDFAHQPVQIGLK